jgi:hypothetical protein
MITDDFEDIAKRLAELKKEPLRSDQSATIELQQADYFAQISNNALVEAIEALMVMGETQ